MKNFISVKYIVIAVVSTLLFACGGGDSKKDDPTPPDDDNIVIIDGFAPDTIERTIFDMTVDTKSGQELGNDFPVINNKIIHEYIYKNLFYLYNEGYEGWQYRGRTSYQHNGDEATVSLTLDKSNAKYDIIYNFTEETAGTWQATFNNGLSELSGTFSTKPLPWAGQLEFLGTIINEQDLYSNSTQVTYQYKVYLPENYSSSNSGYPVIYSTDGQKGVDELLAHSVQTMQKDIVVVAITEGPKNRRNTDYLFPGSTAYLDFLALELIPLVESQYHIDNNQRTLFGYSYGGIFVRHALINETQRPLFKNFIASDGPYYPQDSVYRKLEEQAYTTNSLANRKLYLGGATGFDGFSSSVNAFKNTLESYGLHNFTIYQESFDVTHGQIVLPTIRGALPIIFP